MPADVSAAPDQALNGANPQTNGEHAVPESQPQPAERRSSLLNALNIPAEVQAAVFKPEAEAGAGTEDAAPETVPVPPADEVAGETPAAESEPADTEPAQEPEAEPKGEAPEWAQKRIDKLTAQKNRERTRADETAAKLEEAIARVAQLEAEPAVTVTPHAGDPLADVLDLQTLQRKVEAARATKRWCRQYPDGIRVNEGTDKERVISQEEIAGFLSDAEEVIEEHAPRKERQLQLKGQNDTLAREKFPELYNRASEDYQVAQIAMREIPGLALHPAANVFIGYYLRGVHADIAAEKKTATKTAVNPDLDPRLTAAHQKTIPPLAPLAPRAPSSAGVHSGSKRIAEAMQNVVTEGGTRESLAAAIRAKRESAARTDPRGAVLV